MAESTLTLLYEDIANEISFMLYGQPLYTALTAAQQTNLVRIIRNGYLQFLYPPASDQIEPGYEWSFMKPWTTLDLIAAYSTGTLEVASGTCTLSGGTWPAWAYTHGILTIASTEYTVSSRDSDTELTVVGDDVAAGEDDWSLEHDGDYDLPDDFGRLIDGYYFSRDDQKKYVLGGVPASKILSLRNNNDTTGQPRLAAEVIKATGATTGQRREVWFWPRPTVAYTLNYKYEAFVGTFAAGQYPAGSTKYTDTLRESCLAAAELRMNDAPGTHWGVFMQKLAAAVARDKKQDATFVGNVGRANEIVKRGDTISNYTLQVGDTVVQS